MKDNNTSQIKIYLSNSLQICWIEAEAEVEVEVEILLTIFSTLTFTLTLIRSLILASYQLIFIVN